MAMRRPRIKAAANLVNVKRKPKAPAVATKTDEIKKDTTQANQEPIAEVINESEKETQKAESTPVQIENNESATAEKETIESNKNQSAKRETNENNESESAKKETIPLAAEDALPTSNEVAFKQPTKIENYKQVTMDMPLGSPFHNFGSTPTYKPEDIDNIMHMDLQRNANELPMSPTKQQQQQQQTRPRIRPSPIIGQRRNSYVGCSPSPHTAVNNEESTNEFIMPSPRRERYHSTSLSFGNSGSSPHKYMPMLNSRTRTDSSCSAFSDVVSSAQITTNPFMLTKIRKPNTHEVTNSRSNWLKDYESRCPNGVLDKTRLKMHDLIYYNPTTNPMQTKQNDNNTNSNIENTKLECKIEDICEKKQQTAPVPQLKLNANNELVLDDKSLEIETTAEQEARKLLANTSLVFVDENTGTNGFYRRQKRTKEWTHDQTIKFYRCLQTVGTDFSLMVQLFPTRNRRDLKLKFKKEERINGALINKAILYPKSFDIDQLKEQLEVDERKCEEELRKWREIDAKAVAKVQKLNVKTKAERILQNGVDIYENENVPKYKMSKRAKKTIEKNTSKNSEETQNVDKQISEETNKMLTVLKKHVEKSLASREEQQKPRNKKHKIANDNNNGGTKLTKPRTKKIKTETVEEKNHISQEEVENSQLECELEELLDIDSVQQQSKETAETQFGKTIMDLDKGQAIHIFSQDGYKPEDASENVIESQMKKDCYTFFNITEVRTLNTSPKEFMSEDESDYTFENNFYGTTISTAIESKTIAATTTEQNNDLSFKNNIDEVDVVNDHAKKEQTAEEEGNDYPFSDNFYETTIATTTETQTAETTASEQNNDLSFKIDVDEIDLVSDQAKKEEKKVEEEGNTIQKIMQQIEEGGLMLVSSIDPNNLDNVINEIYMIDKNTGDLCAQPLDLPYDIVQSIVELAT